MEKDPATSVPRTEPESFSGTQSSSRTTVKVPSGTQSSSLSTIKVPSEYKTAETVRFREPGDKPQKAVISSDDTTEICSPVHRKLHSKSSISIGNTAGDISHGLQNIQLTPRRRASTTEGMVVPNQSPSAADCESPSMRPKISEPQNKTIFGSWRKTSDIRLSTPSALGISSPPSSSYSGELNHGIRQRRSKSSVTPFTRILEKSDISTVPQDKVAQARASVSSHKINLKPNLHDQKSKIDSSSSSSSSYKSFQNEGGNKSDYDTRGGKHLKSSISIHSAFHSPSEDEYIGGGNKTRSSVQMSSDKFTSYGKKASCSITGAIEMSGKFSSKGKKVKCSFAEAIQLPTDRETNFVLSSKKTATNEYTLQAKRTKSSISSFNDPIQSQADAERTKTSISSFSGPVEMHDDVNMNVVDGIKTSSSCPMQMPDVVDLHGADRTTSVSGPVQMLADVDMCDSEGTKKSVSMSSGTFQIPTDRRISDAHVTENSVTTPGGHLKSSVDVHKSDTIRTNLLATSHVDPIQTVGDANGTKGSISSFTSSTSGQVQTAIDEPEVDKSKNLVSLSNVPIQTRVVTPSNLDKPTKSQEIQTVGDANGTKGSISSFTSSTSGQVQTAIDEPEVDKSKNLVSLSNVPIQTRVVTPSNLDKPTKSQEGPDFRKKAKASTTIESVSDASNKSHSSISITKVPSPTTEKVADNLISKQRSVKSSADVTSSRRMEDDDDNNFLQKPPPKRKALSKSNNKPTETEPDHDVEESSLFHLMCSDTLSVQTIVVDWVESYKENRHKALLVLLQFVLDAAGCKGKITPAMLQPLDGEQLVELMSFKLDKATVEKIGRQTIKSDRKWKTFILNLEIFIQLLVKLCQNSIIYDQFLLDNLTNLFLAMTTSSVRVFRYIASFIALKLMTALLDLSEIVRTNISHTLRQIEVVRSSVRHNNERLEVLMDKEQELQENLEELEQVFSFYYKEMFKERYRDVAPVIRSMCIVELGEWMKKVPEKFVHDSHLRYVGWLLQDPMGDVRLSCLQVLHAVYKVQTLKERLITFTCKFTGRFVIMTLDKRIDVSVLAIEIYSFIYKFFPEFRERKDVQHMYNLMFSKHRAVAHAAGVFFSNTISEIPCQLSEKSRHGKRWLPNIPFLYKMVRIFAELKMQKYEAYLVDSLIETNEALRDWECMTDLLLEEPENDIDALSDPEENFLINVLLHCIQQSVSKVGPPGREISGKMLSKKERKQIHDDKIKITEHFIEKLPMLLTKYETDPENLQRLLSIPEYLELDMYATPRKDQYLDKLLEKLRTITERHHSKEVLESCIKTLEILCDTSNSTSHHGTVTCNRIIDTILAKFKHALTEFRSSNDVDVLPSEDQVFAMSYCARKVAIFYDHFNLSEWHVWGNVFPLIEEVREDNILIPEEMIQHCIRLCYLSLLWDLRDVERPEKQDDSTIVDKVKALRNHLEKLLDNLQKLLRMSLKNCKEEAFITICDLLIIFKEGGNLALKSNLLPLEYSPSRDLQLELLNIVEELVFSDENKEVQSVNQCNILACFIKLFLYNVIPIKAAANILVHYNKPSSDYGILLKETLDKLLVKNRKNCSYIVLLTLKMAFMKLLNSDEDIRCNNQGYSNLLELAKNLTNVFENDLIRNREAVVNLHIEGINLALEPLQECDQIPQAPPDSLIFLEVLTELTHILLPQDGRVIVKYLDQEMTSLHLPRDWPLQTYRNALLHLKVKKSVQAPATRKGRYEKKNITDSGSEEERERRRQEELIVTSETDGRLHSRSSNTTPSGRRRGSSIMKRRLPVKVIRHPSGQLRHQVAFSESPLTISDIPEVSGTLIHPSSTPYVKH